MFYKSTIIGEIISSIFGYFKISNTSVPARDIERTMLEFNKAWLKLVEEYTVPWSVWK